MRKQFAEWLKYMDRSKGLLCFSRSWRNPVMWGHYAKNHTGLCYGFDADPETFVDVRYVSERIYPEITAENFYDHVGENQMVDLFATKFTHWSYEEEVRLLVYFENEISPDEHTFYKFNDKMKLREVIVAPNSRIKVNEIMPWVDRNEVNVFKSRLAFQSFSVVRQRNKSLW